MAKQFKDLYVLFAGPSTCDIEKASSVLANEALLVKRERQTTMQNELVKNHSLEGIQLRFGFVRGFADYGQQGTAKQIKKMIEKELKKHLFDLMVVVIR